MSDKTTVAPKQVKYKGRIYVRAGSTCDKCGADCEAEGECKACGPEDAGEAVACDDKKAGVSTGTAPLPEKVKYKGEVYVIAKTVGDVLLAPEKVKYKGAVYVKVEAANKPPTAKCKCGKKTLKLNKKSNQYASKLSMTDGRRHSKGSCPRVVGLHKKSGPSGKARKHNLKPRDRHLL